MTRPTLSPVLVGCYIRNDFQANPPGLADLISQAEHGPDTPAILITTSEEVGRKTIESVRKQLKNLRTADIASVSWENYGEVQVVDNLGALAASYTLVTHYAITDEAFALADTYASEHVQILTECPRMPLSSSCGNSYCCHHRGSSSQDAPLRCSLFRQGDLRFLWGQGKLFSAVLLISNTFSPVHRNQSVGAHYIRELVLTVSSVLPTRHTARYTGGVSMSNFYQYGLKVLC